MATTDDPYAKIRGVCPVCGMGQVWMCSARDCPKSTDQKEVRDAWSERMKNPPEPESNSNVPGPAKR